MNPSIQDPAPNCATYQVDSPDPTPTINPASTMIRVILDDPTTIGTLPVTMLGGQSVTIRANSDATIPIRITALDMTNAVNVVSTEVYW